MSQKTNFLPIALNVEGRALLIVGGGPVAFKRFEQWEGRGAFVKVVATEFSEDFQNWEIKNDLVEFCERPFEAGDLAYCDLVYIATANASLNFFIENLCREQRIWCARADSDDSNYLSLSLVEQGDLQIAIGSGGKSPALVKMIREKIETVLDLEQIEKQIGLLAQLKERLKTDISDQGRRAILIKKALQLSLEDLERLLEDETIYSRYTR